MVSACYLTEQPFHYRLEFFDCLSPEELISPDVYAMPVGVTTVVDAGTSGAESFATTPTRSIRIQSTRPRRSAAA